MKGLLQRKYSSIKKIIIKENKKRRAPHIDQSQGKFQKSRVAYYHTIDGTTALYGTAIPPSCGPDHRLHYTYSRSDLRKVNQLLLLGRLLLLLTLVHCEQAHASLQSALWMPQSAHRSANSAILNSSVHTLKHSHHIFCCNCEWSMLKF